MYETAIGALLGNIGGVNVMRTVGSVPGSDLSRARPDFLYHAAVDDLTGGFGSTAIENNYLLPYSDTYSTPTSAMGISSADAMQDWIVEQYIAEIKKAKVADASERAYYKELEHKYLRGNISEEEFEELRKLENIWGQFDAAAKTNGISAKERYRKLEQKFRNGNINEQELNEWIELEDALKQVSKLNVISEAAAEWEESLRRNQHNDTINKTMDFWEEIKRNGQVERGKQAFEGDGTLHWEKTSRSHRVAAERRNAFLDRMERSNARSYWVEGIFYGYRPVFLRNASSYAKEVVSELQKFGITKYFVFDGDS